MEGSALDEFEPADLAPARLDILFEHCQRHHAGCISRDLRRQQGTFRDSLAQVAKNPLRKKKVSTELKARPVELRMLPIRVCAEKRLRTTW